MEELLIVPLTRIVVWAEQGLGDCIQFCRYLSLLLYLDVDFEFHCHSSLVSLFESWFIGSFPVKTLTTTNSPLDF